MAERLTDVQRFVQLCSASERKSLLSSGDISGVTKVCEFVSAERLFVGTHLTLACDFPEGFAAHSRQGVNLLH